jgi:hypothetical protein
VYIDRQNSIEDTARILVLGKGRLRRLLVEHGIEVRPTGQNSAAGRRSRVQLKRCGCASEPPRGATLRELAATTGRSVPWVTARIRRR